MSAKPRGDYSLGAYASGVRDLLAALGHSHATVVGHSLGGGIALQFAYQFPQNCERLILVASGGLGRTVSPLLRSVVLPGAGLVLPVVTHPRLSEVAGWIVRRAAKLQRLSEVTVRESVRHFSSLADPDRRKAFLCTARAVLDIGGQRIDARDRLYLASSMPTMLLWGSRDPVIPLRHGRRAAALMPGSRLEIFENSGHFPHCDEPDRFSAALLSFLRRTDPARLGIDDLSVKLTADTASWRGTATA
jgi:pimeloyl-ACP methyl ester carboxylesterase